MYSHMYIRTLRGVTGRLQLLKPQGLKPYIRNPKSRFTLDSVH